MSANPSPNLQPVELQPEAPALVPPTQTLRGFPLGTILLRLGLLPGDTINEALAEADDAGIPLGAYLVERGQLDEARLAWALATQKGFPFVDITAAALHESALELLPAHAANTLRALPLGYRTGKPVVAISEPTDADLIERIRLAIGRDFVVAVTGPRELQAALAAAYEPVAAVPSTVPAPAPAPEPSSASPDEQALRSVFRVVICLASNERLDVGVWADPEPAGRCRQGLVAELDRGWLDYEGRLLRADAVISSDVVESPLL